MVTIIDSFLKIVKDIKGDSSIVTFEIDLEESLVNMLLPSSIIVSLCFKHFSKTTDNIQTYLTY